MTTQTSTAGALARQSLSYTGNGVLTAFAVTFPVTDRSKVVVTVAGTVSTAYTWNAGNTQITFTAAPANSAAIKIIEGGSKHVSAAVLPNVLDTKSTVGLADQPSRTLVTKTNKRVFQIGVGDAVTTVFQIGQNISIAGNVTFQSAGSNVTATLAADKRSVTFAAAPANTAVLTMAETVVDTNFDDATAGGPLNGAGTLVRTNH